MRYAQAYPVAAPALAFLALASAFVLSLLLQDASVETLMREGGPVENATAVLYIVAIGSVWAARSAAFGSVDALAGTALLLAGLSREINLRTLLERHLEWDAALPFDPLVWIVVLVVCPAAWLVVRYGAALARELRHARPVAVALATAAACIVISQFMDRLPSLVGSLGRSLSVQWKLTALSIEEVLELAVPALVVVAALGGLARWRRSPDRQAES